VAPSDAKSAEAEAIIRSAYRRRSLECHPDKRPGDPAAAAKFAALTSAKESLLLDAARRAGKLLWAGSGQVTEEPEHSWASDPVISARRAAAAAAKAAAKAAFATPSSTTRSSQWARASDDEDSEAEAAREKRCADAAAAKEQRTARSLHKQSEEKLAEEAFCNNNSNNNNNSNHNPRQGQDEPPSKSRRLCRDQSAACVVTEVSSECESDSGSSSSPEVEETPLDLAFANFRGFWRPESTNEQSPRRYLFLLPAGGLGHLRPDQQISLLFAYDLVSK
ncbi:unnamed protein product, partial [Polarella glacialis]